MSLVCRLDVARAADAVRGQMAYADPYQRVVCGTADAPNHVQIPKDRMAVVLSLVPCSKEYFENFDCPDRTLKRRLAAIRKMNDFFVLMLPTR
jgi:hypothetical protein